MNDNPNYYDNQVLDIAEKDFSTEETITINEEPTFIINKNSTTNKDAFTFTSNNKLDQIKQIKESLNVDLKTAQKIVEELHEKMGGGIVKYVESRMVKENGEYTTIKNEFLLNEIISEKEFNTLIKNAKKQ
ncbi:hypothetical protein JM80_0397 [Cellulophaga sp. RHA_52]|uniref:hypothetical protein n=1 Tax=Cellulophaga sp. RHA_52 TaxID=1250036 RepID=UPI00119B0834|nr:hypothetical protein [Cellulophaga sp. RHA_52]TVZ07917.1 hypothetical protein JM80_0397 [Cellulophaga sp. RHA_52]